MVDVRGSLANMHRSNPALSHEGGTGAQPTDSKKRGAGAVNVVEKKRASLDARHRYLLEKFAAYVDEKAAVLENSLLQGNKLEFVNDFFAEGGARKVMFFWQPAPKDEAPRPVAGVPAAKTSSLVVTNGTKEVLTGVGCFFVRATSKAITVANITSDVSCGVINADILPSLTVMVRHVVMPALKAQDNWGVLTRHKDESVKAFMEVLEKFVNDLDVAMVNLSESVQLHPCTVDLDAYKKPSEYANAAHNPDVVNALE
ncbi:hypothetical protein BDK51DRAFT_27536, partial [Blyttiomyces helicus]